MLQQVAPVVDYRGIHFNGEFFHSKTKTLCTHCANPVCDDFAAKECGEFVPTLKFTSMKGLDGEFNTFRIGRAWSRRLRPGMTIALMNSKRKQIMSFAEVTGIMVGGKESMALEFAKDNHSIMALNIKDDVPNTMLKRLKNASGTMIYNANDDATVIYMKVTSHVENKEENLG